MNDLGSCIRTFTFIFNFNSETFFLLFLAALTSSRSLVVGPLVRLSVCLLFGWSVGHVCEKVTFTPKITQPLHTKNHTTSSHTKKSRNLSTKKSCNLQKKSHATWMSEWEKSHNLSTHKIMQPLSKRDQKKLFFHQNKLFSLFFLLS